MGFTVDCSGLIITHLLYKTALVLASIRWFLCSTLRDLGMLLSTSFHGDLIHSPTTSPCTVSARAIRESLPVATYGEVRRKLPDCGSTCAVCLNELGCRDKVWELHNCCHVFHRRCLDRWLDHDEHKTCPLCRAPLLSTASVAVAETAAVHRTESVSAAIHRPEPSWAVERLLYLFGDDLLS